MTTTINGTSGVDNIKDGTIVAADFAPGVGPVFTKEYVSAEQTITSGGLLTIPHGLGVAPKIIQRTFVCKVADAGYNIGDVIILGSDYWANVSTSQLGDAIRVDATNLYVKFSGAPQVYQTINPSTTAPAGLTNTSWRLIVRAWA